MAIVQEGRIFILACDGCGEREYFNSYMDAVEGRSELNWKARKVDGEWENYCEECQA